MNSVVLTNKKSTSTNFSFSLKKALFPFLFAIFMLFFAVLCIRYNDTGVPVLCYHQVYDDATDYYALPTQKFEEQMAYLKKEGYTTITLDDLYNHYTNDTPLPPKPVVITFDDGYVDNFTYAYPILKKYQHKATIFIATEDVGKQIYTSRRLSWDNIRTMKKEGLIDFQSHTANHVNLLDIMDKKALMDELKGSREKIEQETGKAADYIAYPTGSYNKKIVDYCKKAGYKMGFTIDIGFTNKKDGLYNLKRIPIFNSNEENLYVFKIRLELTPALQIMETLTKDFEERNYKMISDVFPCFE